MIFDLDQLDQCWLCTASWDVISEKKLIEPGFQKVDEYRTMDLDKLYPFIKKLNRSVKRGLNSERKPLNMLNMNPSINVLAQYE